MTAASLDDRLGGEAFSNLLTFVVNQQYSDLSPGHNEFYIRQGRMHNSPQSRYFAASSLPRSLY